METVFFPMRPMTVLDVNAAPKFLARLLASDASKVPEGGVVRSVMLTATGGVLGTVLLARAGEQRYCLYLPDENADVLEAWVRQVSKAFDAEVVTRKIHCLPFLGTLSGEAPAKGRIVQGQEVTLINRGWVCYAVGTQESLTALQGKLVAAGMQCGEAGVLEALRILAREPATGLEFDEATSPLEAGLEDVPDFTDPARVFIGRALTEARAEKGGYEKLQLVAFDVAFDPAQLTEVPLVIVGELGYQPTSIARIPDMNLTVCLVRLPSGVSVGDTLPALVKTDPQTRSKAVLVIAPQA